MKKFLKKKNVKLFFYAFIPFLFLMVIPLITFINIIKKTDFKSGPLNDIINFKEPGLDFKYKNYWDELNKNSQNDLSFYKNKIMSTLRNHCHEVDETVDKDKFIKKFSFNPSKSPVVNKNSETDGVYLGFQVFGDAAPSFSQNGETERYQISNYEALEKAGYDIYINNNNSNLMEVTNLTKDKYLYEKDNLIYNKLENVEESDSIFYKLNDSYKVNESSYYSSATLKVIAVLNNKNNQNINENKPKTLKCIDPLYNSDSRKQIEIKLVKSNSTDFFQWNLYLWMLYSYNNKYDYIKLFAASIIFNLYCTAGESFMDYSDPDSRLYKIKNEPLVGLDSIFQAGLTTEEIKNWNLVDPKLLIGTRDADQLYYAYKFNSFYDRFLFKDLFSFGRANIYVTLDQNMPIAKEGGTLKTLIKRESNLINKNEMDKINVLDSLPYNKWIEFDKQISDFVKKTWNRVAEIAKRMT